MYVPIPTEGVILGKQMQASMVNAMIRSNIGLSRLAFITVTHNTLHRTSTLIQYLFFFGGRGATHFAINVASGSHSNGVVLFY